MLHFAVIYLNFFSILLQQVQKEYEESGKGRYPKSKSRNQIIITSEDVA